MEFKAREKMYRIWDGKELKFLKESVRVLRDGTDYKVSFGSVFHDDYDVTWDEPDYVITERTGLYDSEGVRIREGDICECIDETHVEYGEKDLVEFSDGGFFPFSLPNMYDPENPKDYKVIGNVFENEELIK